MFFDFNWLLGAAFILFVLLGGYIKWSAKKRKKVVSNLSVETSSTESRLYSWRDRFRRGLEKTHRATWGAIAHLLSSSLDADQMEQLEELLLSSDLSVQFVEDFLKKLRKEMDSGEVAIVAAKKLLRNQFSRAVTSEKLNKFLEIWQGHSTDLEVHQQQQSVILLAGINGAGKTTTIGKIAYKLSQLKKSVLLAAGDTFRAAAVSQLAIWAERASVAIIIPKEGEESAALAFRATEQSIKDQRDWCLIDTAGRLHQQEQLMQELKKCFQVVSKQVKPEQLYCFLVIDAMQGKAVLRQAEAFNRVLPLDGIVVTKCDGSAKAGMLLEIVAQLGVPIILCGVGEELEDLNTFDPELFIETLLA